MIETTKDVFEEKLKRLFQKEKSTEIDIIFQCLSLILYSTANNTDLIELYRLVDVDTFVQIVSLFDGRTVKFPTKKELRNNLLLAILYYYREIKGMNWDEIKAQFPFEISSISYGIQIKHLSNFVSQKMQELLRRMEEENGTKN